MDAAETSRPATVDEVRRFLSGNPYNAAIRGRSWQGIAIDRLSSYCTDNMAVGPRDHHVISINLADHPYVRSQRCGRVYESAGLAGEASIIPAGIGSVWTGKIPPHLSIRFAPHALLEMASEMRRSFYPFTDIANHFRIRDPFIANMAAIFSLELTRAPHPAQDVLIESLTTALLMHLLRGYTSSPWQEARPLLGVGPASLRRALSYIEDQPTARVSLDDLAQAAGLSRFHFSRLFRKHVGVGPTAYIERARLERAKAMIRLGHMSLADIAHAVGFSDQSHFARRFRHHEGRTPSDYAREFGG